MSASVSKPPSLAPLRDFPDWHSPIVVKEMRHGLRTRTFTGALILLHGLLAMLMLGALSGADEPTVTYVFWGITGALLLGILPLRGFAVLSSEMSEGTLDMLTLTSISSFRIVYGKWAALFSQTLLVASSLLPYMIARYQFGGVEILREGVVLVILVLCSALSTAALVSFSAQRSILLRLLLLAITAFFILSAGIFIISSVLESFGDSLVRSFLDLRGWEQWALVAGTLALTAYGVFVFLSLGASRIAPPSENHSTMKRLVALGVMGVLTVAGCALVFFHSDNDAGLWALFPACAFTLILGVDVMTESMPRFPTVAAAFVARGKWARWAGRFLYPGWASGVAFYLVLCVFPGLIFAAISVKYHSGTIWEDSAITTFLCLMIANLTPVCVRVYQSNRFGHWWVTQLGVIALGFLILMLMDATDLKGLSVLGWMTPGTALMMTTTYTYDHAMFRWWGMGSCFVFASMALYHAVREMKIYQDLEAEVHALRPKPPDTGLTNHEAA